VISERGQGAAGLGVAPRRPFGPLAAHLDRPGALPAVGLLINEHAVDDVHHRQIVGRQPAGTVLNEELGPVTLGDDLVAEPHPNPAAGRLDKRCRRLETGHDPPIGDVSEEGLAHLMGSGHGR
jgi:hypothetical protein